MLILQPSQMSAQRAKMTQPLIGELIADGMTATG
jgi:hypothetical protein